jgi:MFS family permease
MGLCADFLVGLSACVFLSLSLRSSSCLTTVTYAIAYFLPIILREGMGFSIGTSQCLVAPPYVFAAILMYLTAWVGDKYHIRGPILIFNAIIALIGLPIMVRRPNWLWDHLIVNMMQGYATNDGVRYFGVFLVTGGANANIPACMAYQANNIRGQWKRAFCSATLVGFGGIGGIAGSLVFRSQDAPAYRPGIYAAVACNILIILIVSVLSVYFSVCNRKQARGLKVIGGQEGFRYTI